jgi:hypothetical protein
VPSPPQTPQPSKPASQVAQSEPDQAGSHTQISQPSRANTTMPLPEHSGSGNSGHVKSHGNTEDPVLLRKLRCSDSHARPGCSCESQSKASQ